MSDDLSPQYLLEIEGQEVLRNVTQFIKQVEFESGDGMIDMGRVIATNPDHILSKAKVFMPGNEMNIYMGYGNSIELVGRVILMAPEINFPIDGIPEIEVVGYTKDYLMRESKPNPGEKKRIAALEAAKSAAKGARKKRLAAVLKKLKQPVVYKDSSIAEIVSDRAIGYGFTEDIDEAPWPKGGVIHPAKMSDYKLLQALSNLSGFVWWVDYNFDDGWTLHFKDSSKDMNVQDTTHKFLYGVGNQSTLLRFVPKMQFRGHYNELLVRGTVWEKGKPTFKEITVVEEGDSEADLDFSGSLEAIEGELGSAEAVKLYMGDYAFDVIPKIEFHSEGALELWAEQWFRRMREQFIVGEGEIIGLNTLRARQIHEFEGMGNPYDGKYYFGRVRHSISAETGYRCEFNVRKILED